jgi:ribosomal protein S18 acetylase RimI-like enzyme
VDTLFTVQKWRRKGIASALYAEAEKQCQDSEVDNLFVWVHPNNHRMLSFLKSRGYDVLNLIEVRKPWNNERLSRTYSFDDSELRY